MVVSGSSDNTEGEGKKSNGGRPVLKNLKWNCGCIAKDAHQEQSLLITKKLQAGSLGKQQERSYKTDHVNVKRVFLKSRRDSRGPPEWYRDSRTLTNGEVDV